MNVQVPLVSISRQSCTSMLVKWELHYLLYHIGKSAQVWYDTVLLTLSAFRTSLIRHHEYLLRFDGEGHYEFRE